VPDAANQNNDVERVKDAADIVRIVGEHVALKAKGREWVGLCPFHDDHRPSMYVVPAKQMFHCFVCGAGGDVLGFVQRFHKMEFREALEFLAEKAGVELAKRRDQFAGGSYSSGGSDGSSGGGVGSGARVSPRRELLRASTTANSFFRQILQHAEHGAAARELIARRGISPAMVEAFEIGAAPDRWDGLLLTLQASGLDPEPSAEVGLLKRRDVEKGGGYYDAFRNRLMFPIHDSIGRVIAFGGRRLRDEKDADGNDKEAKYLNSAESRIFDKSSTLFALHQASRSIQTQDCAVVTEGYTDVIACHQAGFTNVVATLGTALTRQHAAMLRRVCSSVVLLFDGDEAGERAGERAFEKVFEILFKDVFVQHPLDIKVAMMDAHTDAKDPDELLKREGGREVFATVLGSPVDLLAYRFGRLRERLKGKGISAVSRAVEDELARLVELGLNECEPVRRRLILKHLSNVSGVDEATIQRVIPAGRGRAMSMPMNVEPAVPGTSKAAAELAVGPLSASRLLLGCVLCDGTLWLSATQDERDLIAGAGYGSVLLEAVHKCVTAAADSGRVPDIHGVLALSEDEDVRSVATALWTRVEQTTKDNADALREQWRAGLNALASERARRQVAEAKPAVGAADDSAELAALNMLTNLPPDQRQRRGVIPRPR
jgi:DNA primase